MNRFIRNLALVLAGSFALATAPAQAQGAGGKFYGVWWDGSDEHFVSVDPSTGTHSSLAVIPGVKYVDASFRLFDPDSGRFVFVGGGATGSMSYYVLDAVTGSVIATSPRADNLKNPVYDPGSGRVYGTWWSDSSVQEYDSLGHPKPVKLKGTEYFASIDPRSGARFDVPIPGLLLLGASSQFFDSDSGRYVVWGKDTANAPSYYVIDVSSGNVVSRIPLDDPLDFPVYNPVLRAVQGLWWSDSTVREYDSLGRPKPVTPSQIHGMEYFVTVGADSSVTMVPLPGVKWISNFNRALDTDSQRYVFTGKAATGPMRYYVVDAATGALLSSAEAAGNVLHLVYAPEGSTFYPWNGAVALRPGTNRAWSLRTHANEREIVFENPSGAPHTFIIHDPAGRMVRRIDGIRGGSVRFGTAGLKPGAHFFRLSGPKGLTAAGKFVVE